MEDVSMSDDKSGYLGILQKRADEARKRLESTQSNVPAMAEQDSLIDSNSEDILTIDVFKFVSYRTDIDSLNFPIFALSKNLNTDEIIYEYKNTKLTITPSSCGQATMFDKDLWIYCISKLAQAVYEKKHITPTIRFSMSDFLRMVGRRIDGRSHARAKDSFDRLDGTRVKLEIMAGKKIITQKFGLLEGWRTIENQNGIMEYVQVTLPQWVFKSILNGQVKKISSEFFSLSKALERRIYEIAAKHCYKNPRWSFSLTLLKTKCGSKDELKGFRRNIKAIAKANKLPDYELIFHSDNDMVEFVNRDPVIQERAAKKAAKKQQEAMANNVMKIINGNK
jgi:plasmid replication initiation protein